MKLIFFFFFIVSLSLFHDEYSQGSWHGSKLRVVAPVSVLLTSTFWITCHLQGANSTNKESTALKAEFTAMIEAAKSKMHQVRAVSIMNVTALIHSTLIKHNLKGLQSLTCSKLS